MLHGVSVRSGAYGNVQEPVFGYRIRSYWLSLSHDRADRMEAATKLYMWKPERVIRLLRSVFCSVPFCS